jgi:hypothetical protein
MPALCHRPADFGDINVFTEGSEKAVLSRANDNGKIGAHTKRTLAKGSVKIGLAQPEHGCSPEITCKIQSGKSQTCANTVVLLKTGGGCSDYEKALNLMRATKGTVSGIMIQDTAEETKEGLVTLKRDTLNDEMDQAEKGRASAALAQCAHNPPPPDPPNHPLASADFSVPVVSINLETGDELRRLLKKEHSPQVGFEFSEHDSIERCARKTRASD